VSCFFVDNLHFETSPFILKHSSVLLQFLMLVIYLFPGDVFDIEVTCAWEFNATFPIRSVALPYFVVGIPYSCLKYVAPFISLWFGINIKTPYLLLVLPRLFACLLSFVSDYSMYRICYLYGQNYRARLLTLASSYVTLVYGTRTFSNSTEMALNSLLLYVVAYCMRHSDQVRTTNTVIYNHYEWLLLDSVFSQFSQG